MATETPGASQTKEIWLVVTAHPDDESMFFIPTLRNLLSQRPREDGPIIQMLCLSTGDYRDVSDGPIRTKEMHRACSLIGIQNRKENAFSAVTVLDDERMKDGPNEVWSPDLVSETVLKHIRKWVSLIASKDGISPRKPKHDYLLSDPNEEVQSWHFTEKRTQQSSSSTSAEKYPIQSINLNILTFDEGGVSGHPNHVDVFRGVQYLLNEKCNVTQNKLETTAKLHLCPEQKGAKNDAVNNIIEVTVSVHTLRTITNPIQKYVLWAFVDIMPYLFILLFQVACYLIYFLVGGLLWSKAAPQIQPFSGRKSVNGGMQYRIMDPILVWMAMAAHHSQFVWYRRLSVMFSRYTYINDLQQLTIDGPPYVEEEDDDIASLPPVVTIKEEDSSPEFLLKPIQMNALREAVLPPGLHHRPWKRIYSLSRDGDSFVAFQKLMEGWNQTQGGQSSLLVVKTATGEMIGGYASVPIIPLALPTAGSAANSCLFRLKSVKDCEDPIVDVYGKLCSTSSKKIVFDASRHIIAFGGGDNDGGLDEGFGLCLEDEFARGTTARCAAFQNESLISGQDGVFDVLDVEVWGFAFGQF